MLAETVTQPYQSGHLDWGRGVDWRIDVPHPDGWRLSLDPGIGGGLVLYINCIAGIQN